MSVQLSCPNINSPEWKALVKRYGKDRAYKIFVEKGVPVIEKKIDDKYGERLWDIIRVVDRRIKILQNKDKEAPANLRALHTELLQKLVESQDDAIYKSSLLHFVETFSSQLTDIDLSIQALSKIDEELKKDLTEEQKAKLRRDKASTIVEMRRYILSMIPILEGIRKDLILSNDEIDKAIVEKISSQLTILEKNKEIIAKQAVPLAAMLYAPFIGVRNDPALLEAINKTLPEGKKVKAINIEELIMEADKDIGFLSRWLDSMSDTDDDMLKLINEVVATSKVKARLQGESVRKRLLNSRDKLFNSGITSFNWIFEKNEFGKLTGNFIEEVQRNRFNKDVNDFFKKLNEKYGVKIDKSEIFADKEKYQNYIKEVEDWYEKNTEINPIYKKELDMLIAQVSTFSKEIQEKRIASYKRVKQDMTKGRIGKEFYIPKKSIYENKTFTGMTAAQKEFYNEIVAIKDELDALLPPGLSFGRLVPMVGKDDLERIMSIRSKKDVMEMLSKFTKIRDYETELGDAATEKAGYLNTNQAEYAYILRNANKDVGFLPIYFTKKLDNMDTNLSMDIVSSMILYSNMAHDYSEMNKVIDTLELTRDMMRERKVTRRQGNKEVRSVSNVAGTVSSEKVYVDSPKSMERLDDYFSMVIYGRMRKEGKNINILGMDINVDKALDTIGKYTAVNQLALNLFAGIANVTYGNTMMRVEALAGKYGSMSQSDLNQGTIDYYACLPGKLAQIGVVNPTDRLSLWMERFNVLQDFEADSKETDAIRRTRIAKLFNTSTLFFTNKAGEHYMQGRLSLSLANKQKLLLNGKEITLFNAYEVKGNRLVLKEGVTKLDGSAWTMDDEVRFIRKQDYINQRLNGIYNDSDRSAIQATAMGRLALMFRKFIVPGVHRRFDKMNFNYMNDQWEEGSYKTLINFFTNAMHDIKAGQFALHKSWNDLTDFQKGNMLRNLGEFTALIGTMIVLGFLGSGDDGDRDKWWWNAAAYSAYRLRSDLFFYSNPAETLKIINSPAAATGQISNVFNFVGLTLTMIAPWNWSDWSEDRFTVQSGPYKGWSKWNKSLFQTFPMTRTIVNTINPEERMIYWKKNTY